MRRLFLPICVFALVLAFGWFPYSWVRQARESTLSITSCEGNGIGAWQMILEREQGPNGQLPDARGRALLATRYRAQSTHFALVCNTDAPYQWDEGVRRMTPAEQARPLAWCGRSHGFTERWRNVLFSDLSVRRVREGTQRERDPAHLR